MGVTICILIGLPAVGKTTLAVLLKERLISLGVHVLVINYDELMPKEIKFEKSETAIVKKNVTECAEQNQEQNWKSYRNDIIQLVYKKVKFLKNNDSTSEKMLVRDANNFCTCFELNNDIRQTTHHVILIDDNMFYRSMRYRYFQLARSSGCSYCQIYIKGDIDVCVERNSYRENTLVTMDTIIKMEALIQEPDPVKYYWENNTQVLENNAQFDQNTIEEVCIFINKSSETIVAPVTEKESVAQEMDRKKCLESFLHQCDQVTRKFVSTQMREYKSRSNNKNELQMLGKKLNDKRKRFLEEISTEDIESFFEMSQEVVITEMMKERIIETFKIYMNVSEKID